MAKQKGQTRSEQEVLKRTKERKALEDKVDKINEDTFRRKKSGGV